MYFGPHLVNPAVSAVGAACMFFFGRKLSKSAVNCICVGLVALAFRPVRRGLAVLRILGRLLVALRRRRRPPGWVLGDGSSNDVTNGEHMVQFKADAGLLDPLSSIWRPFVTGVGMLIHIYSTGYMAHEGGYYRFFGHLNLFMFSMLTYLAEQLRAYVRGLGGCRPRVVPADWVLLSAPGVDRGEESVHSEPHR